MNEDEQHIRNLVSTWMNATQAGDSETVLALMADDAKFLVAGQTPFGKDVFAKMAQDQKKKKWKSNLKARFWKLRLPVIGHL